MKTYGTVRKSRASQDLSSVCRMCLSRHSEMINIFAEDEPLSNTTVIEFCTGIECDPKDGLPSVICQECYRYLLDFFTFKKMCLSTDKNLKVSRDMAVKEAENPTTVPGIRSLEPNDELCLVNSEQNGLVLLETDCIHPGAPYDVLSQIEENEEKSQVLPCRFVDANDISNDCEEEIEENSLNEVDDDINSLEPDSSNLPLKPVRSNSHNVLKMYICHLCSNQYGARTSLRRHLLTHQGKPFQCSQCEKQFAQKDSLKRHLPLHTNRDYSCSLCAKPLVSKEGLRCHMRTHHSDKRDLSYFKHKCMYCEKKFAHSSGLSRHMRIHRSSQSGKQFLCSSCNSAFSTNSELTKHLAIHALKENERTISISADAVPP